jgi:hypothetical protein
MRDIHRSINGKTSVNLKLAAIALAAAGAATLSACGGDTVIEQAPEAHKNYATITVAIPDPPTVVVPMDVRTLLDYRLKDRLYHEGKFQQGPALTLHYQVVQFDPGIRMARAYSLGMGGKGSIIVEVFYTDADGAVVGRLRSTGIVTGGSMGGTDAHAVQDAVNQIFDHTVEMYH